MGNYRVTSRRSGKQPPRQSRFRQYTGSGENRRAGSESGYCRKAVKNIKNVNHKKQSGSLRSVAVGLVLVMLFSMLTANLSSVYELIRIFAQAAV